MHSFRVFSSVILTTAMLIGTLSGCELFSSSTSSTGEQTDMTISSVLLPESVAPGEEFGDDVRVTVYNQGTTVIPGGFMLEIVISSDREAPIAPAEETTTFVEDGRLPNGRIIMPTLNPETTFTTTFPGMRMVSDAPLDELIFICAVVDPEHKVDEQWRGYPMGIGVNKLCMPLDIVP